MGMLKDMGMRLMASKISKTMEAEVKKRTGKTIKVDISKLKITNVGNKVLISLEANGEVDRNDFDRVVPFLGL